MLYLGNFSYNTADDTEESICTLPCICNADSPEAALEKFHARFEEIYNDTDFLDGVECIYLDSLVEVEGELLVPVVANWQKTYTSEDELATISCALPCIDEQDNVRAYIMGGDDECGCENDECGCDDDSCSCQDDQCGCSCDDQDGKVIDSVEKLEETVFDMVDGVEEEPFIIFQ